MENVKGQRHYYPMGIIGNCNYLSYIDMTGNVVWQCWPRFDSSFIFGGLIDKEKGGHFFIRPAKAGFKTRQYYEKNSNVLITEFEAEDGAFRVIDFAPRYYLYDRHYKPLTLMRKVVLLKGSPRVHVSCKPKYQYGEESLRERFGSNHIQYEGAVQECRLTTNASLEYVKESIPFLLTETKYFVLTFGQPLEAPLEATVEEMLMKTSRYWQKWTKRSSIPSVFQESVIRSMLALKLHYYEDTGGIIAAGTTSLPEAPGTERNWDYRYCWMRDSYYTLQAFNSTSHFSELGEYAYYIHNIASENEDFQPVYSICGKNNIEERKIPLRGYKGFGPVRVGNQAYVQKQFDVYGQLLLSLLPLYVDARLIHSEQTQSLELIFKLLDKIEEKMEEPDAGLWEFREKKLLHCHTYLFHWAGCLAAIKIAKKFNDKVLLNKAQKLRDISAEFIEKCYCPKMKCYTNSIGSTDLDASLFLLVSMGYVDPKSQRAKDHVDTLCRELRSDNGLFYRYKHLDDFGNTDSSFLVCYFWYIEALATLGKIDEAIEGLEKVLMYTNHLGLFSEDLHGPKFDQWGNFPQTYSHVGVINCAFRIANKLDRPAFKEGPEGPKAEDFLDI